jgi:hypothetical protein
MLQNTALSTSILIRRTQGKMLEIKGILVNFSSNIGYTGRHSRQLIEGSRMSLVYRVVQLENQEMSDDL